MSEPNEREDLESLLKAPGWLRLINHSRKEWAGDGYAAKIKLAIRHATEKNENVAEAVQRVDAANDEVNAVLSWPKDRVQTLLTQEAQRQSSLVTLSRRGGL
jgi:ABC-type Fe2+-enterobactin transport system substrate-binding protein